MERIFLLPCLFLPLLFACGNTPEGNGDHEQPAISISYPSQNTTWHIGDTVGIQATFTDNDELGALYLSVTGPAPDSDLYYEINQSLAGDSVYHFYQTWAVSGVNNPPVDALLTITVYDMNNNFAVASRDVNIIE